MSTLKEVAKRVLQQEGKALHYKDITKLALEQGFFETTGKTPEASINSQIILDIKHKGKHSDFIKVSPSVYALNPHKTFEAVVEKETEDKEEEKTKIES
jgi:restriction system protein